MKTKERFIFNDFSTQLHRMWKSDENRCSYAIHAIHVQPEDRHLYLRATMATTQLPSLQGDSGGLGYVDINSVSFRGYPETMLSQHNPVREQMGHPV